MAKRGRKPLSNKEKKMKMIYFRLPREEAEALKKMAKKMNITQNKLAYRIITGWVQMALEGDGLAVEMVVRPIVTYTAKTIQDVQKDKAFDKYRKILPDLPDEEEVDSINAVGFIHN